MSTYDEILAQNAVFKAALENGSITQDEYDEAMRVQNLQLQALQAQGEITQDDYNAAMQEQGSGGVMGILQKKYVGLPLFVWLIIAVAAIIAVVIVVSEKR
jgi:predicted RNA-binding protein associated with RNAse of E/G family